MLRKNFTWRNLLLLAVTCVLFGHAKADVEIEIVGVGSQQYPIAIAPFQGEVGLTQPLTPLIPSDLSRIELFESLDSFSGVMR